MKSFMISSSIRCRKRSKSFAPYRPQFFILKPEVPGIYDINELPSQQFLIKHGNFYENYA